MNENILITIDNHNTSMDPYLEHYPQLTQFLISCIVFYFTNARLGSIVDWDEVYDHLKWDTYLEIKQEESFNKQSEMVPDFFDDNKDYIIKILYPACVFREGLKNVQYLTCKRKRITFLLRVIHNAKPTIPN